MAFVELKKVKGCGIILIPLTPFKLIVDRDEYGWFVQCPILELNVPCDMTHEGILEIQEIICGEYLRLEGMNYPTLHVNDRKRFDLLNKLFCKSRHEWA